MTEPEDYGLEELQSGPDGEAVPVVRPEKGDDATVPTTADDHDW